MNVIEEQKLATVFDKHAQLQAALELVYDIRDPVMPNSPLLRAASQVRNSVRGLLGRISDDNVEQISASLDEGWNALIPPLQAFIARQRLVGAPSSVDGDCEHFQGIPQFDEDGLLSPGMHHASWDEFVARFGHTDRRFRQSQGLLAALINLQEAGCKQAHVGGSFVTAKEDPTDVDYVFAPEGLDLSKLEPMLDRANYLAHRQARGHFGIDGGAGDLQYVRSHLQRRTIFECDMVTLDDPQLAFLGSLPRSRLVGSIALDLTQPLPPTTNFSPFGMWDDVATRMQFCGRF
ncbi:MAG: hypothetical protein JSS86_00900 [Cyanobacteria bacterium SZAS LIN-2]|nr:hypothetical protein [Cyanobacteria bacterium SZAS LIN-2]